MLDNSVKNRADWTRVILHADMDAFFAAVEQRDHPEYAGKPVLVGGTGKRGVVSTASYEARPYGCHSAMPMAEARRRCPGAVFLSPDFARYSEVSRAIMVVFRRFSPLVEPLSLDEAFLDMTGAEGLFGEPEAMARRLKAEVKEASGGLIVSVGAAPNKFVAKVASDFRKPDGLVVVPPASVASFLRPLPVSRLWGVGPKTEARLLSLGLATIGDVALSPRKALVARLGDLGHHLHDLANGVDDRPVVPEREAVSVGAETTLETDVTGSEAILPYLRRSANRVARRLRREGLVAGCLRVKLKTAGFRLVTRQAPLGSPTDSAKDLESAARALLPLFDLAVPYRLVGLAAFDLAPAGRRPVQPDLFSTGDRERARRLDRVMDGLKNRFGEDAVRWGTDGPKAPGDREPGKGDGN